MPITWRVTYFYSQANYGWSETWWKTTADLVELAPFVSSYLYTRATMLTTRVGIVGVRIANDKLPRTGGFYRPFNTPIAGTGAATIYLNIPNTGTQNPTTFTNSTRGGDQVKACLVTELRTAQGRLGFRYVDGIPDDVSDSEPSVTDFRNPSIWWGAFRTWTAQVIGIWSVKSRNKGTALPPIPGIGWQINPAAPNDIGIVVGAALGDAYKRGAFVYISGVRMAAPGLRSPNRRWIISSVVAIDATTTVVYLAGSSIVDPRKFTTNGSIQIPGTDYITPSQITPYIVSTHKRGGPFPRPVGRRKIPRYV